MSTCPKCQQPVKEQAIKCPYCMTELKAFGHPGIRLHQAASSEFLCDNCIYHADDTCDFPQRPYAKTCTLYQSVEMSAAEQIKKPLYPTDPFKKIQVWCYRNRGILLLIGLVLISFIIALVSLSR